MSLREVPEVTRSIVVDLACPRRVENHRLAAAVDHEGPFCCDRMPVQFARRTGIEGHVDARDPLADRELVDGGFFRPAARGHLRNVAIE